MPTLREFIASRKSEIHKKLSELRHELSELDAAEEAIASDTPSQREPSISTSHSRTTIKDMIVEVLQRVPNGLESNEIIDKIRGQFDAEVPRTSMSPQLSRLKAEGVLAVDGKRWLLWENRYTNAGDPPPHDDVGGLNG